MTDPCPDCGVAGRPPGRDDHPVPDWPGVLRTAEDVADARDTLASWADWAEIRHSAGDPSVHQWRDHVAAIARRITDCAVYAGLEPP